MRPPAGALLLPLLVLALLVSIGFAGCVRAPSDAWVNDLRAHVEHVEVRYGHQPDEVLDVPFSWDPDAAPSLQKGAALADQLILGVHAITDAYKEVGLDANQSRALHNASLYVRVQLDQIVSVELPDRGTTSEFDSIMMVYTIDPAADPRFVEDRGWTRHVITCWHDHCSRGWPHEATQRHEETAGLAQKVLEDHGIPGPFPGGA